jgi:hypothetical protein
LVNLALELVGFVLLVAAAATVGPGLAMLVAGVLLVAAANRPTRPPPDPRR